MPADNDSAFLLERRGSWRAWPYLLIVLVCGYVGIRGLVDTVSATVADGFKWVDLGGYLLAIFFISLFLGIASLLLYRMIFRSSWSTRIDERGITMSAWHVPWKDVTRVFTKASAAAFGRTWRVSLNFHRRSGIPLNYGIQGFEFLTPDEADEILDAFDSYLKKTHPDIEIEE